MSLNYESQNTLPIIGSKNAAGTRTASTLTAAYDVPANTKAFETGGYTKLNLDILYTTGAGETANSIEIRVDGSPDGINYYRIPNETVSSGTSTLSAREFTFVNTNAATAETISIGLDIFYKYTRVSVKETGVVTNFGSAYVEYTLSGK